VLLELAKVPVAPPTEGFVEVLKPAGLPHVELLVGGNSVPAVVLADSAEVPGMPLDGGRKAPGSGMPEDAAVYRRFLERLPEVLAAVAPNKPPEVVGDSAGNTDSCNMLVFFRFALRVEIACLLKGSAAAQLNFRPAM